MEENKEMLELLKQIEKNSRRQARTGRILCALMLVLIVCFAGVCGTVWMLLPRLEASVDQVQTVLRNLEQTTNQLAALDLEHMIGDVDTLVRTGQQSLEQAMTKLDTIDFETLNQAIQDLAKVVEPLAKLTKVFG